MGAIFSGIVGGCIADRWGRKCSLMFTGVPYVAGYLTLSYAHYSTNATIFKIFLFGGRFMTGVGMGSTSVVVPVSEYIMLLESQCSLMSCSTCVLAVTASLAIVHHCHMLTIMCHPYNGPEYWDI